MTQEIRQSFLQVPTFTTALADPNDISPHTDVIKKRLQATSTDPNATEEQRNQARAMLQKFYPETAPADPQRWAGQGNLTGGAITKGNA